MDKPTDRHARLAVVNGDETAQIVRIAAARWHAARGVAMCAYPTVPAAHQLVFEHLGVLDSAAQGSTSQNPPRPST